MFRCYANLNFMSAALFGTGKRVGKLGKKGEKLNLYLAEDNSLPSGKRDGFLDSTWANRKLPVCWHQIKGAI
jgi:hypothetical protein